MYSNMMDKSLDSVPFLTESAFSQTHENAIKQALTVFDTNSIFGDKSRIRKYRFQCLCARLLFRIFRLGRADVDEVRFHLPLRPTFRTLASP